MRVWGFHAHALCERLIASSIVESLSDSDVNGGNGAMSASGCSDCLSLGQRRVDDVVSVIFVQGSSPHARGRLLAQVAGMNWERITPPACAGKTSTAEKYTFFCTDHPRMRGEDWVYRISGSCPTGSPPHARGRRDWGAPVREQERITPACAGKTSDHSTEDDSQEDHPRVRGEDCVPAIITPFLRGSPPHARGRPLPRLIAKVMG